MKVIEVENKKINFAKKIQKITWSNDKRFWKKKRRKT